MAPQPTRFSVVISTGVGLLSQRLRLNRLARQVDMYPVLPPGVVIGPGGLPAPEGVPMPPVSMPVPPLPFPFPAIATQG
jgi:hypothetical protein